jgi:hypothetical protein
MGLKTYAVKKILEAEGALHRCIEAETKEEFEQELVRLEFLVQRLRGMTAWEEN